jgi:hypothetical protein
MGRNILLGFAGPGEVSPNNVKDLLRDHLQLGPEDSKGLPTFHEDVDEIRVVIPAAEAYWNPTMDLLLEWTDAYADLPYEAVFDHETRENRRILDNAEKAFPARNVGAALIERLVEGQKDGDDVALIVAWGTEGDDRTELLVDLASVKNIKVLDLTKGLDDLVFGDPGDPEPEPETPPTRRGGRRTAKTAETADKSDEEPEKPAPRRGKPRKAAEASPAPAEATSDDSVEQDVSRARQAAQKTTEAVGVPEDDPVRRALLAASHYIAAQDAMNAAKNLAEAIEPSPLSLLLAEAVEAYQPLKRGPGRPRKDGTPAKARGPEDRSVKEWLNEDGEWVKAGRGRIPKGVHTRTVDPQTGVVLDQD